MVKVYLRPDLSGLKEEFIVMAEGLDPVLASGPLALDVISRETLDDYAMDPRRILSAYEDSIAAMPVTRTQSGGLETSYHHHGKAILMACPAQHPNGQTAAENWAEWLRWRARASIGLPNRDEPATKHKNEQARMQSTILSALNVPMP